MVVKVALSPINFRPPLHSWRQLVGLFFNDLQVFLMDKSEQSLSPRLQHKQFLDIALNGNISL